MTPNAAKKLADLDADHDASRARPTREGIARDYVMSRGRISTTELADLVGASPTNVGDVLKNLAREGLVEPSRPSGRGRGLCYRLAMGRT